ncbi:hypothetical protein ACTQW9_12260 [Lachnospiraceae bacterium LCP19S3_B12]
MKNKLRMFYYLPGQSELFSELQIFETDDGKEWKRAVNIAHEKGYKIVHVERVKKSTRPGRVKPGERMI